MCKSFYDFPNYLVTMTSDLIVIFLLSPQAKKSVSVEEVSVQSDSHSYGLGRQSSPIPQDPFSAGKKLCGNRGDCTW